MKERKVKRHLAIVTFVMLFMALSNWNGYQRSYALTVHPMIETVNDFQYSNVVTANNMTDSTAKTNAELLNTIKLNMVEEVNEFIKLRYKGYDERLPEQLVNYALQYDIDLCFMMAQAKHETGFGTLGQGRPSSRYSLFGVRDKYSSYASAIESYCKLLKKSYLGDKKTELDLMKNYVNLSGHRYAQDRRYEVIVSKTYKDIKGSTKIYELQNEYKKNS